MFFKIALGLISAIGVGAIGAEKMRLKEEKEEKERKENELKAIESIKFHTIRCKKEVLKLEEVWAERFNSLIVIDSNIWMEQEFARFFEKLEWVMEKFSSTITMSSVQFDEIINLKNLPYSNPKSKLARCALARIEHFQKQDLIDIIPMQLEASKYAYADPDIIKFLVKSSSEYSFMTLVSNDRELRIRTNQILKDKSKSKFLSITGDDLNKLISNYEQNLNFLANNT